MENLNAAEESIIRNPTTYRIRYKKKIRGFVVRRFPYVVLYIVDGEDINVIAVFNTNMNPKAWMKRVK